jgi:hypothetical protein
MAHFLWELGVIVSIVVIAFVVGDLAKPEAAWGLTGLIFIGLFLAVLLPINVIGSIAIWATRRHLIATVGAIALLGGAWAWIGILLSLDEAFPSGPVIWLTTAGVVFGVLVARAFRSMSRQERGTSPE